MLFTLAECHEVDFPKEAIEVYSIGDYNDCFEQLNLDYIHKLCVADGWQEDVIEALMIALEENVVGVMDDYADRTYNNLCDETEADYYGG